MLWEKTSHKSQTIQSVGETKFLVLKNTFSPTHILPIGASVLLTNVTSTATILVE